ncbi:hypothetical protein GWQ43_05620 [Alcaligenes faecalis]|uniref:hypothetical protein n=1 Tax=Alcaligenes faecalis TaxID=511 RepID=UPI00137C3ED9|nr:hypothetical protein [Alcaligenes faecalis]QHS35586.1 hypothetical protein GWQ43_05620 [Alcaligenes faecalis]
MQIYPIPESLCDTYDGEEWALAAIHGERVVALRYLSDIAPSAVVDQINGASAEFSIREWLRKSPMELCQLHALGAVSAGLVSSDGFAEAWVVQRDGDW